MRIESIANYQSAVADKVKFGMRNGEDIDWIFTMTDVDLVRKKTKKGKYVLAISDEDGELFDGLPIFVTYEEDKKIFVAPDGRACLSAPQIDIIWVVNKHDECFANDEEEADARDAEWNALRFLKWFKWHGHETSELKIMAGKARKYHQCIDSDSEASDDSDEEDDE